MAGDGQGLSVIAVPVVPMSLYDEGRIARLSGSLSRSSRTAFAAACAERLWPLVERYAAVVSMPEEDLRVLREALDAAWSVAGGEDRDLEGARESVETLVPSEDVDWVTETAYAQNGIAAIAYAARSWCSDDPQEGVWAARQVYEAADYAQQSQLVESDVSAPAAEQLAQDPILQAAVDGIFDDLAAVSTDSADDVRQRARAAAADFVKLFL